MFIQDHDQHETEIARPFKNRTWMCSVAKMFREEDQMIQCEECLKWTCTKCADISDEQYKFMTEKDQLKWYCVDCNDKPKQAVKNEMLMDYLKNMNDNLSKIKAQLAPKADKAEVTRLNEAKKISYGWGKFFM